MIPKILSSMFSRFLTPRVAAEAVDSVVSRFLTPKITEEAIGQIKTTLTSRGFQWKRTVADPIGIEDHAWFDYHPNPALARHFSEVRIHTDHYIGIHFEAVPVSFTPGQPLSAEAHKALDAVTQDILKDLKALKPQ